MATTDHKFVVKNGLAVGSSIDVINSSGQWIGATGTLSGATGPTGASGSQGINGASGFVGSNGATGVDGASGIQGASGITGASGIQGASGTIGVDGATGSAGATGTNGASGIQGASGTIGVDGATGTAGASGVGASGSTGPQGIQGASGATGTAGTNGTNGASGSTGIGYIALTSTTSLAIGTGSKAFTVNTTAAASAFAAGQRVRASNTGTPANFMEGVIASYTTTTLTITVDFIGGSGTLAAWTITSASNPGSTGATGLTGATGVAGTNGSTGVFGASGVQGASGPGANQSLNTTSGVQFAVLGIGTAALGATGSIRAVDNVTAYYSSDRRLKENIVEIPNALDKVKKIGGKMFDWTDEYIQNHGGLDPYFQPKSDFGVIAQDVQEVFPVAVRTKADGMLAVDYEKLCALAFAAIKELNDKIDSK